MDRGMIGSGMTARTTAHLATALDDYYKDLISARGEDCARLYYQSVIAAISRAEAIQDLENIDCDFCRLDGLPVPGRSAQHRPQPSLAQTFKWRTAEAHLSGGTKAFRKRPGVFASQRGRSRSTPMEPAKDRGCE
jgi:hypothetical protein